MFEVFGGGPPADWEPIPDEVLAEIGAWDEIDPPPADLVPALGTPDDLVWQAVERTLGVETLPLIAATSVSDLSDSACSHALRRLDELSAHLESVKARLTARIAGPTPTTEAARQDDFSAHEVGVATRSSVYAADRRIFLARDLASRLQASAAALESGRMTYVQAMALSESTCHLDLDLAREIESNMLRFSHRQDLTHFKVALRRWLEKLDTGFTKRANAERQECVVDHRAVGDGSGELFIRGPLDITTQLSMALTAHAAKSRDDLGGTAAQRKLAALRDMVEAYLDSPDAAKRQGRLPVLNITIDLGTLLGLRAGIAEIPGVGAIPADVAWWLLADGAPLRRLIIDPDNGQLLDYGTSTYTVPPRLADLLIAKNLTSASPHSSVESAGCDMEHNLPHDQGGATNPLNNTPVDRRWHRAKTHADWTYEKDPDTGVVTWTSPISGLTCQIDPHDYRLGP